MKSGSPQKTSPGKAAFFLQREVLSLGAAALKQVTSSVREADLLQNE